MELYNEDCFDRLIKIQDKSVHLVVSDPPYGISFGGNDWDRLSKEEYTNLMIRYLSEVKRILVDNGSAWIFFGPSMVMEFLNAVKKVGLYPHLDNWKSICRQKGRGAKYKLKSQREDFILLTKNPTNYVMNNVSDLFNYKENITNVLNYFTGEVERPPFVFSNVIYNFKMPYYLSKTEKHIHSCQKSILLLYALIMNSSKKGDIVFDGFAGSGSCMIASKLADRDFIGCELDSEMHKKALKWFESFDFNDYRKNYLKWRWGTV